MFRTKETGADRAAARLRAKLNANKDIPSGERMTRQRRRAAARAKARQARIAPAEFARRKMKAINTGRSK